MGEDIYGGFRPAMERVLNRLRSELEREDRQRLAQRGERLFEHLNTRIKAEDSMREKLRRRGLAETPRNALREVQDAIGLRVVCLFIDDVYEIAALLEGLPGCRVAQVKDYIRNAKPNGYRSYHMILEVETEEADVDGAVPGRFWAEVQLRTIAMDTWAALEHEMKYKKNISEPELISQELHRVANELASCDVSMQALRRVIREL